MVVSMLMLIAVLLFGASAARIAWQGEKAARSERDRHTAFQAAEDGIMDAERDIQGGGSDAGTGRGALFGDDGALGFADGCGSGVSQGLCASGGADGADDANAAPAWQRVDLPGDEGGGEAVTHGQFTGAAMQTGDGFLPFRRPRYVIERLPDHQPGEEAGPAPAYIYRVTAMGFGARPGTEVVLQTVYRKAD
ncbi:pilus assembly protein PilX [Oxalobacteraceae bacterium]|nr:pilus assembly protein PilX [Oxalobacteraceae bacterium]